MPDIFISYAHLDNKPFSENEKGWVTHLVSHLSTELGRADDYDLWKDYKLKGSDAVTPEIDEQVQKAETLVLILSNAWLASKWCQKELTLFFESHDDLKNRIFVVEIDKIKQEDKSKILHDLLGHRFWYETDQKSIRQLGYPVPNPQNNDYFDSVIDLSHDIAEKIKAIQQTTPVIEFKQTVYIAAVNDSLYNERKQLISELKQFQIDVLPRNNSLDKIIDDNLEKCSHFIQLLNSDWQMGIPQGQHLVAEASEKPILQWRDPKLVYADSQYQDQIELLEGETVIATPLADFIRTVRKAVLPEPEPEIKPEDELIRPNGKQMVFVHAGQDDFDNAYKVAQQLKAKGYLISHNFQLSLKVDTA